MSDTFATAALVVGGIVQDVMVGDAAWAREALDGDWQDTTGLRVGRGYMLVDGEFRYPQPYPSWVWENSEWVAPIPSPDGAEGGYWEWDEAAGDWVWFETADVEA